MMKLRWRYGFFLIFAAIFGVNGANYRFEGIYRYPDGEERLFLVLQFLRYNPNILAMQCKSDAASQCEYWWPCGRLHTESAVKDKGDQTFDFIWVGSEGDELQRLQGIQDVLQMASVIYTPTHFQDSSYANLRLFLEFSGFSLLSHWYWEGEQGNAIFVRKELYDAALRSLNYTPHPAYFVNCPSVYDLKKHFRKIPEKPKGHAFESIDYIYMINLNERPEKFAKAAGGLQSHGIHPYRFSAVNGWKLSIDTITQIGVRNFPGIFNTHLMGSVYCEVNGVKYRSNQLLQEDHSTYFALGMSQGAIGIILSHLSVLQDAYDSGYKTIWVMEDDVEVLENPKQILALIGQLDTLDPTWDVLFTDTDQKNSLGEYVPCRAVAARPNYSMETLDQFFQKFYSISNDLSRVGMRYGAYSMIIRRSGIEKILNYFKSYGVFLPYDMDFWLAPNLKMYRTNRDIVIHAVGAITDNNLPHYLEKN